MNSSVWAIWAAQGSKEKNQFEYFLATFEGGDFNFSWANFFFKYCSVHTKKLHKMKVRKLYFFFKENKYGIFIG